MSLLERTPRADRLRTFIASLVYGAHGNPSGHVRLFSVDDEEWIDICFCNAPTFALRRVTDLDAEVPE